MAKDTTLTVKKRDTYHHGNLPSVLVKEAVALLEEKGAEGFSLRALARRVGVGVATPSHHFAGAKGVLTAVAAQGFEKLTSCQEEAMAEHGDPIQKVVALCQTYVEMGVSNPGYAAVMFRWDMVDQNNAAYMKASTAALNTLKTAVTKAAPSDNVPTDLDHAAKTLWAAMHGFVTLSLSQGDAGKERIEFAVRTLLDGMQAQAR